MADDDVQLTDLEVIQRYSLAVRGASAPRAELVAALEADLAWLSAGRRRTPAPPAPAAKPDRPAAPAKAAKPAKPVKSTPAKSTPAKSSPAKSTPAKRTGKA